MTISSLSSLLVLILLFHTRTNAAEQVIERQETPSQKENNIIQTDRCRFQLTPEGHLESLSFFHQGKWDNIAFRKDQFAGPAWIVKGLKEHDRQMPRPKNPKSDRISNDADPEIIKLALVKEEKMTFSSSRDGIYYRLRYKPEPDRLTIEATIKNSTEKEFSPVGAGLQLGIDTCMVDFPQWNDIHFPTLLRCEKTHFWGYFMSPAGSIAGISSPDPIASWSHRYNGTGQHRIYTSHLYFLNQGPLPARHPQNLHTLKPGEERTWTIHLTGHSSLSEVKKELAAAIKAPMIDAKGNYTLLPGQSAKATIYNSDLPEAVLFSPNGTQTSLTSTRIADGQFELTLSPKDGAGVYRVQVRNENGKESEAMFYCRRPWSWYMEQARKSIIAAPPVAAPYAEWWYNCVTIFPARRIVPLQKEDDLVEKMFRENILPKVFNTETGQARMRPDRIQKTGTIVSILTDAYRTKGDIRDLELAARIADWHADHNQGTDGAYRYNKTGHHYTSVIYPAKGMMKLVNLEKHMGKTDPIWTKRAEKHHASVKSAIDDLQRNLDNIGTEGEHTFEDGMVSCSALQLAYFALMQENPAEREKYARAARTLFEKHRCLQQLEIPDCRMNGGTMRFWEAIYDLRMSPNMLQSPHGWSSWKTYAAYYLYLLYGEENLLRETMDAAGSAMQLIDPQSGKLRWAFIPDPFIRAYARTESPDHPGKEIYTNKIVGEQYMDMNHTWYSDQASDNDVHEHFAMMDEVAANKAFVLERKDKSLLAYNCKAERQGDTLVIHPMENCVTAVHLNLYGKQAVKVQFAKHLEEKTYPSGMHWVTEDSQSPFNPPAF